MTQQTVTSPPVIPVHMLEPEYIASMGDHARKWFAKEGLHVDLVDTGDVCVEDTLAFVIAHSTNVEERPVAKEWARHVISNALYLDYVLATASAAAEAEAAPAPAAATKPAPASVFVEEDLHWTDVEKCDSGRDWGTYYVKIPGSLVRALKQVDGAEGRIGIRHVRLFTAANLHTKDGNGGRGLATSAELARESGWSKRSITKAITKGSPLAEWVVKTGMTSEGRITFEMYSLKDDEQWFRVPWWWLWEESTWPTPARATIRPTITDKALLAGLAIQLAVDPKNIKWVLDAAGKKMAASATISTYGTQGLATGIGVDERLVKEGLREGHGIGWFLNSNDNVDPEHVGGRSITPRRTVIFHRPSALNVRPSALNVPPSTLSVPPL